MSWENLQQKNTKSGSEKEQIPPILSNTGTKSESSDLIWSDEKIKEWLFKGTEKSSSNVCCALYGFDGTAKSGIAMDCRTEQEKKDGMKLIIFDLDGGCAPLKVIYHDNNSNIIIKNPLVRNVEKNVDYEATFGKLKSALDYIERNLSKMKIKAVIFDGLDKFLKICEYSMRIDLGKSTIDGIPYQYWKLRSQKYHDILEQIRLMDVDRFFITHLKNSGETDTKGDVVLLPDWEKKTGDLIFQRVLCYRETKVEDGDKVVYIKAKIEKCKTNIGFEGAVFTISESRQHTNGTTSAKWFGLRFEKNNTVWQKNYKLKEMK